MTKSPTSDDKTDSADRLLRLVRTVALELHPRQSRIESLGLDHSLQHDFALDSLGRVELVSRIEKRFGVALPERFSATAETARDLLDAVAGSPGRQALHTGVVSAAPALDAAAAPEEARTLVEVLDWHATRHPERPHIRFYQDDGEGAVISFGELKRGALEVARGLQQRGLEVGQAVALMLPTSSDYFFSFFGVLLAGGVPVPIYPPARPAQLEDHLRRQAGILRNCRAAFLITVPEARRLAGLLRGQAESLRAVLTVDAIGTDEGDYVPVWPAADDLAFIQYTSGSTGSPKGVMLTHANLLANIRADGRAIEADSSDVFVSWLPLYHDMGLIGAWLGSLYFAPLLVIMSPIAFLTRPQRWLWAIHRYRATISAAPNFAYELCLQKIADEDLDGLDLASWRIAFNGAETVSPDSVTRFCDRFARFGFRRESMFPVYGLAECSLGVSFPPRGRGPTIDRVRREAFLRDGKALPAAEAGDAALSFVGCGYPLAGHEVRIVDKDDRELPERERGHLQFRGPSATAGYFDNPAETARLLHGEWLDSGDLAYIAQGEIFITGRAKDVIIRAGRNLFPDELEGEIGEIDGIRNGRVAVFASVDPKTATERLVVLAETRERDPQAQQQLIARINRVAVDLADGPPDDIVLAPPGTVLKTSSGKIRRSACRELYESGRLGERQRALWWQLARLWWSGSATRLRRLRKQLREGLYAMYCWPVFVLLSGLVFALVFVMPTPATRWRVLHHGTRLFGRICFVPPEVRGIDRLPPPERACIFVANHASYIDAFVVLAALPRSFAFLAKAELGSNPVMRAFLKRIGTELIERFDMAQGVIDTRRATQAASAGRSLMVFAEGTFTRMPGLLPFHMGGFVAAVEAGLPVVPVAIRGTRSMLRPDSWFPRHGRMTVTIGAPLEAERDARDPWAAAIELRDATREFILEHCGEPDLAHEKSPL